MGSPRKWRASKFLSNRRERDGHMIRSSSRQGNIEELISTTYREKDTDFRYGRGRRDALDFLRYYTVTHQSIISQDIAGWPDIINCATPNGRGEKGKWGRTETPVKLALCHKQKVGRKGLNITNAISSKKPSSSLSPSFPQETARASEKSVQLRFLAAKRSATIPCSIHPIRPIAGSCFRQQKKARKASPPKAFSYVSLFQTCLSSFVVILPFSSSRKVNRFSDRIGSKEKVSIPFASCPVSAYHTNSSQLTFNWLFQNLNWQSTTSVADPPGKYGDAVNVDRPVLVYTDHGPLAPDRGWVEQS